jgi:PAS domain S-box-containing protein
MTMQKMPRQHPLSFLLNRNIRFKILTGYMVTVLLAAIVGGTAIVQLNRVNATVDHLTTSLAQERALAEKTSLQIQRLRLITNQYIYQGQNPADLEAYNQVVNETQMLLNLADQTITEKNRAAKLAQVRTSLEAFAGAFAEIVPILAERQETVVRVLNPQAVICVNQLEILRNNSFEELDFTSAHYASQARDTFGQVQLGVYQYLATGDEQTASQVDRNFESIEAAFDLLFASVRSEPARNRLVEISAAVTAYQQGFQQIRAGAARQRKLVASQLDRYGPEIDQAAAEIASAVNAEFAVQSQSTGRLVSQTRIWLIGTVALALALGLSFGLALSQTITRPIEQMARAAKGIAEGALDQEVTVRSQDELGTLGRAFNDMAAQLRGTLTALQKWAHVFEHAEWGITVDSANGDTFELLNPAFARMHGYTVEELAGKPLLTVFAPETHADVPPNLQLAHEKGHHFWESVHVRKDGSRFPVSLDVTAVRDDRGQVLYRVVNAQDITERQQAADALRESEARLRGVSDNLPGGMVYQLDIDSEGQTRQFTYVSAGVEKLHGLTSAEVLQDAQRLYDQIIEEDRHLIGKQELQAQADLTPFTTEMRYRSPSGEICWSLLASAPRRASNGHTLWDGIEIDITERKQAEEKIKQSLAEKETLLRELYHRTKNNMGVINALLGLQASYFEDERLQKAFEETQDRIRSMALVHQKLYEAKDLSYINLKDYITDLVELLLDSHTPSADQISFETEMDDVLVLIDTAVPCGLILNELISNSLKHAFPAGRTGVIQIHLHRTENGEIQLGVADNGVSIPPGYDLRQDGQMGLQTLFTLAENQLRAQVAFNTETGVACQLLFRDNLYQARV